MKHRGRRRTLIVVVRETAENRCRIFGGAFDACFFGFFRGFWSARGAKPI